MQGRNKGCIVEFDVLPSVIGPAIGHIELASSSHLLLMRPAVLLLRDEN